MSGNLNILGSGIDMVEISRLKDAVQKWGNHFLERVFCPEEIAYAKNHRNPFPHYAGRFAAKEAVLKAVGTEHALGWKDIKILNTKEGKPYCLLNGNTGKTKILISISHTRYHAIASAIVTP